MTDILCRWLNTEIRFDTNVTRDNIGQLFWNGLRFGQVMDYYMLQFRFLKQELWNFSSQLL